MVNLFPIKMVSLAAGLYFLMQPALAQEGLASTAGPCEMQLTVDSSIDWRGPYGRGYDVFDDAPSFEVLNITVEQTGEPCAFFLTAMPMAPTNSAQLDGPDAHLDYDILQTTNGPSFLSQNYVGTDTSRIEGRFAGGRGMHGASLYLTIPTGQFVRGGLYQGQIMVRLFRHGQSGPELVAEAPFAVIAEVPSAMKVRFDGEGEEMRGTQIDLGNLSTPQLHPIGFQIAANTGVLVTFSSENNGLLKHAFARNGIAYSLLFQGKPIDLTQANNQSPIDFAFGRETQYAELLIDVKGTQGNPPAGEYSDRLTITFTTQ